MTQEEKAKAYDEAINRAKSKIKNDKDHVLYEEDITEIFPELKDDETIRKALIDLTYKVYTNTNYLTCVEQERMLAWLEKQSEQKPANKVEPKFHEGDWITNGDYIWQIVNVTDLDYILQSQDGHIVYETISHVDEHFHLWTIQDAKDGDVLVTDNGLAFIFNGYLEEQQWPFAYGGINIYGRFNICDGLLPFTHQKVVPATKEQRDLLFSKIKEAGYEWDADKKELKKIEQRIADNIPQDFEKYVEHLLSLSDGEGHGSPAKVKEVSAELFKLAKLEQKPAWSEEDVKMIETLIAIFEVNYPNGLYKINPIGTTNMQGIYSSEIIKWLKSLKDRVQPKYE